MHLSQNVRGPLVLSYSSKKIHKHRLHFCQPHFLAISETSKIELRHFSNFTKKIRKTLGVNSEVLAANGKTNRPYHFNFFKGCLPQILLGPFLNTLTHLCLQFMGNECPPITSWIFARIIFKICKICLYPTKIYHLYFNEILWSGRHYLWGLSESKLLETKYCIARKHHKHLKLYVF